MRTQLVLLSLATIASMTRAGFLNPIGGPGGGPGDVTRGGAGSATNVDVGASGSGSLSASVEVDPRAVIKDARSGAMPDTPGVQPGFGFGPGPEAGNMVDANLVGGRVDSGFPSDSMSGGMGFDGFPADSGMQGGTGMDFGNMGGAAGDPFITGDAGMGMGADMVGGGGMGGAPGDPFITGDAGMGMGADMMGGRGMGGAAGDPFITGDAGMGTGADMMGGGGMGTNIDASGGMGVDPQGAEMVGTRFDGSNQGLGAIDSSMGMDAGMQGSATVDASVTGMADMGMEPQSGGATRLDAQRGGVMGSGTGQGFGTVDTRMSMDAGMQGSATVDASVTGVADMGMEPQGERSMAMGADAQGPGLTDPNIFGASGVDSGMGMDINTGAGGQGAGGQALTMSGGADAAMFGQGDAAVDAAVPGDMGPEVPGRREANEAATLLRNLMKEKSGFDAMTEPTAPGAVEHHSMIAGPPTDVNQPSVGDTKPTGGVVRTVTEEKSSFKMSGESSFESFSSTATGPADGTESNLVDLNPVVAGSNTVDSKRGTLDFPADGAAATSVDQSVTDVGRAGADKVADSGIAAGLDGVRTDANRAQRLDGRVSAAGEGTAGKSDMGAIDVTISGPGGASAEIKAAGKRDAAISGDTATGTGSAEKSAAGVVDVSVKGPKDGSIDFTAGGRRDAALGGELGGGFDGTKTVVGGADLNIQGKGGASFDVSGGLRHDTSISGDMGRSPGINVVGGADKSVTEKGIGAVDITATGPEGTAELHAAGKRDSTVRGDFGTGFVDNRPMVGGAEAGAGMDMNVLGDKDRGFMGEWGGQAGEVLPETRLIDGGAADIPVLGQEGGADQRRPGTRDSAATDSRGFLGEWGGQAGQVLPETRISDREAFGINVPRQDGGADQRAPGTRDFSAAGSKVVGGETMAGDANLRFGGAGGASVKVAGAGRRDINLSGDMGTVPGGAETTLERRRTRFGEADVRVPGEGGASVKVAGAGRRDINLSGDMGTVPGGAETTLEGRRTRFGEADVRVPGEGGARVRVAGAGRRDINLSGDMGTVPGGAETTLEGRRTRFGEADVRAPGEGGASVKVAGAGRRDINLSGDMRTVPGGAETTLEGRRTRLGEADVRVPGEGGASVRVAGAGRRDINLSGDMGTVPGGAETTLEGRRTRFGEADVRVQGEGGAGVRVAGAGRRDVNLSGDMGTVPGGAETTLEGRRTRFGEADVRVQGEGGAGVRVAGAGRRDINLSGDMGTVPGGAETTFQGRRSRFGEADLRVSGEGGAGVRVAGAGRRGINLSGDMGTVPGGAETTFEGRRTRFGEADVRVQGEGGAGVRVAGAGRRDINLSGDMGTVPGGSETTFEGRRTRFGEADLRVSGEGGAGVRVAGAGRRDINLSGDMGTVPGGAETTFEGRRTRFGDADLRVSGEGGAGVRVAGAGRRDTSVAGDISNAGMNINTVGEKDRGFMGEWGRQADVVPLEAQRGDRGAVDINVQGQGGADLRISGARDSSVTGGTGLDFGGARTLTDGADASFMGQGGASVVGSGDINTGLESGGFGLGGADIQGERRGTMDDAAAFGIDKSNARVLDVSAAGPDSSRADITVAGKRETGLSGDKGAGTATVDRSQAGIIDASFTGAEGGSGSLRSARERDTTATGRVAGLGRGSTINIAGAGRRETRLSGDTGVDGGFNINTGDAGFSGGRRVDASGVISDSRVDPRVADALATISGRMGGTGGGQDFTSTGADMRGGGSLGIGANVVDADRRFRDFSGSKPDSGSASAGLFDWSGEAERKRRLQDGHLSRNVGDASLTMDATRSRSAAGDFSAGLGEGSASFERSGAISATGQRGDASTVSLEGSQRTSGTRFGGAAGQRDATVSLDRSGTLSVTGSRQDGSRPLEGSRDTSITGRLSGTTGFGGGRQLGHVTGERRRGIGGGAGHSLEDRTVRQGEWSETWNYEGAVPAWFRHRVDPAPCRKYNCNLASCYVPNPNDCKGYIVCQRTSMGTYVATRMRCAFGTYWTESNIWTCEKITDKNVDKIDCPNDPCRNSSLKQYPDEDFNNCRSYWTCQNRRSIPHCCPPGKRFDRRISACVKDPHEECREPCPLYQEVCSAVKGADQIKRPFYDGNCLTHWDCGVNGAPHPVCCPDGHSFDAASGRCVQSGCADQCPPEYKEDLCGKVGANGKIINAYNLKDGNCRSFMKCDPNGAGSIAYCCRSGYAFNKETLECQKIFDPLDVCAIEICPDGYFEECRFKPVEDPHYMYDIDAGMIRECGSGTVFDESICTCDFSKEAPRKVCKKEVDARFDQPKKKFSVHNYGDGFISIYGEMPKNASSNGNFYATFDGSTGMEVWRYDHNAFQEVTMKLTFKPFQTNGNQKQILVSNCKTTEVNGGPSFEVTLDPITSMITFTGRSENDMSVVELQYDKTDWNTYTVLFDSKNVVAMIEDYPNALGKADSSSTTLKGELLRGMGPLVFGPCKGRDSKPNNNGFVGQMSEVIFAKCLDEASKTFMGNTLRRMVEGPI